MSDDQDQNIADPSVQPKFMDFVSKGTINPAVKPLQKSQTLMRSAVSNQPDTSVPALTTTAPITTDNSSIVTPKTSVLTVDPSRLSRAENTKMSEQVSRFDVSQPMAIPAEAVSAEPQPVIAPNSTLAPLPVDQPSMNLFDQGIAKATAHDMPPLEPEKHSGGKKIVGALTASLIVIVALGFLVNMNVKRIDVYLAANKAGFSATLPSNAPSGFDLAKVSSAAGIISTQYKSNSDTRNYTITEKQSLWDSSTLLDSYVTSVAGTNYVAYHNDGMEIFIYSNKNATWVNNGIWYLVTSNGSLSNQQLINIASSM